MVTNLAKIVRHNPIVVLILLPFAFFVLLVLFPVYFIKAVFAIISITFAVALPVYQKRFSVFSIFLVVSGVLFLLSGVVDSAYETVVSPLPVLERMEFSRIMRPRQVSSGLWHLGMGMLYIPFAFAWFRSKDTAEKPKSRRLKLFLLILVVFGILDSILGISSIVEGLRIL